MSRAIFVKTGSAGQRYELNVEPTNTIAELKQLLVAQVCGRHPSKRQAAVGVVPRAGIPGLASLIDSLTMTHDFLTRDPVAV
jgi:hypothetical protein